MKIIRSCVIVSAWLTACGAILLAQPPSFEAASVKRNISTQQGGGGGPRGNRFVMTNMPLSALISYAFDPPDGHLWKSQIVGGPEWMDADRFDIEATMPGSAQSIPITRIRAMLESLLEDRFQLKAHRETRELPVYNLVVVNGGPKRSADQTPPDPKNLLISFASAGDPVRDLPRGAIRMIRAPLSTTLEGTALSVPRIVSLLQGQSDRVILNKTNFPALFDAHLEFSSTADQVATGGQNSSAPSLFTAIRALGLKLDSAKTPLPVVVIESAHKPSEN